MTAEEKFTLLAHLDAVWAEETIRDRSGELTADGLHDLVLAATGDETAAQTARARKVLRDRVAAAKGGGK